MSFDPLKETLVSLLLARLRTSGSQTALHVPVGTRPLALAGRGDAPTAEPSGSKGGRFTAITWDELAADVRQSAAALRRLGLAPGDRVAQVSGNRYMWIVIDLAVHLARGVHVALHNALSVEQMAWQIVDSGSHIVLGDDSGPLEALTAAIETQRAGYKSRNVTDQQLAGLAAEFAGTGESQAIEREAEANVKRSDLATILYTSGTTGEPKGVMLSHGNLASNALASLEAFQFQGDDVRLCWLPLSHIYARTTDLYTWIARGCELGLAESRDTLVADMAALHPTIINGVPYFYDKLRRFLVSNEAGIQPGALQKLLGGRMRFCCAGGAPLPDHVAEFFAEQGVTLVQGYGLTETSPVICAGTPEANRIGTVGRAIPGVEVRIADDGEILSRGPHIMQGYWNKPEETAATIKDGWLHTGDVGVLEDGFLRITGRKKELLVLNSGKKVAPAHLEGLLTSDPIVAQAFVVGEGKNYLTALIVPDRDQLRRELAARGVSLETGVDELSLPAAEALVTDRIAARLSGVSDWEQVQKFVFLKRPFSIEHDELTPTLKLRRSVIASHFADEIRWLYSDNRTPGGDPCPLR